MAAAAAAAHGGDGAVGTNAEGEADHNDEPEISEVAKGKRPEGVHRAISDRGNSLSVNASSGNSNAWNPENSFL